MGGRGRIERARVGSYILFVGCYILYLGCACAMWTVTGSALDTQTPCGMLHPLCGLFQELYGVVHAPSRLIKYYVGSHHICGGYCKHPVGSTGTMRDATAYMWAVSSSMYAVTVSMWAIVAPILAIAGVM